MVRRASFEERVAELQRIPRIEIVIEGVERTLARDPSQGRRVGDTELWYWPAADDASLEMLTVYYTVDERRRRVFLMYVVQGPPL